MLGNFSYSNPTKLYFGEDSLNFLNEELPKYGKKVMLVYAGGSIKRTGLYDKIIKILEANGKEFFEDGGVMPNPHCCLSLSYIPHKDSERQQC